MRIGTSFNRSHFCTKALSFYHTTTMGRMKEVYFKVEVQSTLDGHKGCLEYRWKASVPERVTRDLVRLEGLELVQTVRNNGPDGMVKGVRNWRQVKNSAAFFDGDLIKDIDTIVQDLDNHGALAAFVRDAPSISVPFPVFVLSEDDFRRLKEMKGSDSLISLTQIEDIPGVGSSQKHEVGELMKKESQVSFTSDVVTNS